MVHAPAFASTPPPRTLPTLLLLAGSDDQPPGAELTGGTADAFSRSAGPLRTKASLTPPAWTVRCPRSADRTVTCTGCGRGGLLAALGTTCQVNAPIPATAATRAGSLPPSRARV